MDGTLTVALGRGGGLATDVILTLMGVVQRISYMQGMQGDTSDPDDVATFPDTFLANRPDRAPPFPGTPGVRARIKGAYARQDCPALDELN